MSYPSDMPTPDRVMSPVAGGGDMGAWARAFDWSATPLGPVGQWPAGLRAALSLALNAPSPMALWLGRDLVLVYNDAWRALLGADRGWAAGRAGPDALPSGWERLGPALDGVRAGGLTARFDDALLLGRGYTWSCSPIYGEADAVLGVLTTVEERAEPKPAIGVSVAAVLEQLPVAVGVCDAEGRWLFRNAGLARFATNHAPSRDRAAAQRWRGWTAEGAPLDPAQWPDARALRGESVSAPVTFLHTTGEGDELWTRVSAAPLRDGRGSRIGAVWVVQDIDAETRAEGERRQASAILSAINQNATAMVAIKDRESRFVMCSQTVLEIIGRPAAEVIGRSDRDFFGPEQGGQIAANDQRVMRTGVSESFEEHARGRVFYVSKTPYRDETGTVVGVVTIGNDITERKRAEEALRQSEATLSAVLDALPVGVVIADAQGRVVRVNAANNALWGVPPETNTWEQYAEWAGYWPETGERIKAHEWAMSRALLNGEVVQDELVECEQFGSKQRRLYLNNAAPVRDEAGAIVAGVVVELDVTERLAADRALRENEQRLRLAFDAADLGDWEWSVADDTVVLSAQAAEIFGAPAGSRPTWAEMRGWLTPDDAARAGQAVEQALATRSDYAIEYQVRRPADGSEVWVAARGRGRYDAAGRATGMIGVVQDVTDRKRTEEVLHRQSELTQTILENSTACMIMMDTRGYCTYMNRAGEAMFGWTLAEIRQRPLHDMVHHHYPDGRPYPMDECVIGRALPENQAIREHEDMFIRRSGEFFPVLVAASPVVDSAGEAVATVLEVRDVTERWRAEAATRRRSEQLRRLAQAGTRIHAAREVAAILQIVTEEARSLIGAHQAVVSTAVGQGQTINHVSLSDKYARWRTYDAPPDVSGIYTLVARANRPVRLTQAELEAHPSWRGFAHEEGRHPPMRGWLAAPLIGLDGRNRGLIQLSDKHEGEFTEDDEAILVQLAQVASIALENQSLYAQERAARGQAEEASRLKDEFLATVSHELRTPLTAFLGYAELLQRRKRDEAYVARTVEKMVQSARAQAQLIEDLLDISRIVSGRLRIEPAPIELTGVVHAALDTVRPTAEAKRIRLEVDLDPAAGVVLGDANRLQQVVWNLLSNAVKFTYPGGRVAVRLAAAGGSVELRVSDSGQGIEPAFLPYVFDRFRQADGTTQRVHGGLGLGLAIVRHLVELHGGTVTAASAGLGEGAAFTVRLPLTGAWEPAGNAGTAAADADAPRRGASLLNGVRVLVVEDQPALLELLEELLVAEGAIVRGCPTARGALAQVRAWRPDVLVSDIAMPGEDGYWLIEQVRGLPAEEGGATPAVALTAYVRLEDRLHVLAAGFQQYVPKPVDAAELRDAIAGLAVGERRL